MAMLNPSLLAVNTSNKPKSNKRSDCKQCKNVKEEALYNSVFYMKKLFCRVALLRASDAQLTSLQVQPFDEFNIAFPTGF